MIEGHGAITRRIQVYTMKDYPEELRDYEDGTRTTVRMDGSNRLNEDQGEPIETTERIFYRPLTA